MNLYLKMSLFGGCFKVKCQIRRNQYDAILNRMELCEISHLKTLYLETVVVSYQFLIFFFLSECDSVLRKYIRTAGHCKCNVI